MPAIESRVAWSVTEDDRDYVFGFSGHYGRGKNVGTVNNETVAQPVDSWGATADYTPPFTCISNISGEAHVSRALGI
jgi:hypothetical protein